MPHIDILFNQLLQTDLLGIRTATNNFEKAILKSETHYFLYSIYQNKELR